jgi:hypothetical protein
MNGVVVGLLLACSSAACGGGGGGADVATLGGAASTSTTTGGGGGNATDPEDAMVAFSSCMREHGVDLPDPEKVDGSGGGFAISTSDAGSARIGLPAGNDETAKAAQAACGHLLDGAIGNLDISPEEEAKMRDEMLEFASCMREHGVDMPDPTFASGGGGRVEINTSDSSSGKGVAPPPEDPDFAAANEACASKLSGPKGQAGLHAEASK